MEIAENSTGSAWLAKRQMAAQIKIKGNAFNLAVTKRKQKP
jgi:hypothetical protein